MSAIITTHPHIASTEDDVEYYPKARLISFVVLVLMSVPYIMTATSVTLRLMWRTPEPTVTGQSALSMMLPYFGWTTGFVYYAPLMALFIFVQFSRRKIPSILGPVATALFSIATVVGFYLNLIPASPITP